MILAQLNTNKYLVMKTDNNQPNDEKVKSTKTDDDQSTSGREHIDPIDKKETMEEKAKREHWTDVAQSHLGIDE